jgi:putative SOS response-associated peptidase YedK
MPATGFCEYQDTEPRKTSTWFALSEDRRLFAFARLARRTGAEKRVVWGPSRAVSFLTTKAIAILAPIHPKAMPVILTTTEEFDLWLEDETVEALKLQQPCRMAGWRHARLQNSVHASHGRLDDGDVTTYLNREEAQLLKRSPHRCGRHELPVLLGLTLSERWSRAIEWRGST